MNTPLERLTEFAVNLAARGIITSSRLAELLGIPFVEADDLANKAWDAAGQPDLSNMPEHASVAETRRVYYHLRSRVDALKADNALLAEKLAALEAQP
jgi:hypothetical protein